MAGTGSFFADLTELHRLLQEPSYSELTVERILRLIKDEHLSREFFRLLDDPRWIQPLKECGLFENPAHIEHVEGGGVRSNEWPQSKYLARMAESAPLDVAELLKGITTDNWIVAGDIIDAAKLMPGQHAAELVPTIGDLVAELGMSHKLDDVGEIVKKLAKENETDAAVDLVKRAFSISRGRTDDYGYIKGLTESVIPALLPIQPAEVIQLLVRWLIDAIEQDGRRMTADQYSYIWRPAIEDHEQNGDYDFSAKMVVCVRDAAVTAIRERYSGLGDVLELIDRYGYQILSRLRLHLIAEFAEADPKLASTTMLDASLFDDYRYKHEYARLTGKRFNLLDQRQQAEWLGWVDSGPEAMAPDFFDGTEDAETRTAKTEYWQFERLHWIREHLSGKYSDFYERMYAEHGKPELSDLNVYSHGARWGHDSPYTVEELKDMGFAVAIIEISNWRPEPQTRIDTPTAEGLKGTFQQYVATDPATFSKQAALLKHKPALYVRAFLQAIEQAIKDKVDVELESVLGLCDWIVSQPIDEDTASEDEPGALIDRSWQWCRDTIADLVQEIGKAKDKSEHPRFGMEYRERVWNVLAPLADSPTKSNVTREADEDPRLTDWSLHVLNNPRGKALLAVLAYIDWVVDHEVDDRREIDPYPGGFEKMPEVRELLEAQLNCSDDDFTSRAAFGWRVGLLRWLDPPWFEEHADRIFDLRKIETDPSKAFGWAAWNTFLFASRPHREFYKILKDQFSYAVDQATRVDLGKDRSEERPFSQLAEHLIVLYGRGDLGESSEEAWRADNGIIERLVTKTSSPVRSHAMQFVGASLQEVGGTLPRAVKDRFRDLWDRYWVAKGKRDAEAKRDSAVFGYWFGSEAFDPEWALPRLEDFVRAAPKAEPDHMIMKRLARVCEVDPVQSARIVGMMVDGDDQGWRVSSWDNEATKVLEVAVRAGGEAREIAEQVIDRLGRRGLLKFGELLELS